MSLRVGQEAPDFTATAVYDQEFKDITLSSYKGKWVVLFFYPLDFTFVCPTELHAFQQSLAEFEKRNTIVIGASCDTAEVHFAWLNTPKDQGGIEGVTYSLLADSNRNLSSTLGILDITNEEFNTKKSVLLDKIQ